MYCRRLWLLALLLLHVAMAQRSYFIDATCNSPVRGAIYEAINDILPRASVRRNDADLNAILALIYPELAGIQKTKLFGIFGLSHILVFYSRVSLLLTASLHQDDIDTIRAAKGGVGLIEASSASSANIVFYCDDDARWVHPIKEQYSNTNAWYDKANDIVLDLRHNGVRYDPGCRPLPGDRTIAETYTNVIQRAPGVRHHRVPSSDKATITICSRAYTGPDNKYLGFFDMRRGKDLSRRADALHGFAKPTIDKYCLLSAVIVHEV